MFKRHARKRKRISTAKYAKHANRKFRFKIVRVFRVVRGSIGVLRHIDSGGASVPTSRGEGGKDRLTTAREDARPTKTDVAPDGAGNSWRWVSTKMARPRR